VLASAAVGIEKESAVPLDVSIPGSSCIDGVVRDAVA
jgi:hypothetical protein